jgi:Pyruvate/2-oxoacid:ferredoxin oxidoreductase gamma subunit
LRTSYTIYEVEYRTKDSNGKAYRDVFKGRAKYGLVKGRKYENIEPAFLMRLYKDKKWARFTKKHDIELIKYIEKNIKTLTAAYEKAERTREEIPKPIFTKRNEIR